MNEQTISEKFTRVDAALDRIRIKTNTENNAVEDVATAVEALVSPSGTLNINTNGIYNISNYASVNVQTPIQIEPKYVTFYDYDGTVLFAYTEEEIEEMTELPTPPVHEGLVFDMWNWTLQEIKGERHEVNVGALYKDANGLDFKVTVAITDTTVNLRNSSTTDGEIFWGDGTSDHIYSGDNVSHTYAELGTYTLGIKNYDTFNITDFPFSNVDGATIKHLLFGNIVIIDPDSFMNMYNLETIIFSNDTFIGSGGNKFLAYSYRLKHVNLPRMEYCIGFYSTGLTGICFSATVEEMIMGTLRQANNIKSLIFPTAVVSVSNLGGISKGVEKLVLPTQVAVSTVDSCYCLKELKIPKINTTMTAVTNCDSLLKLDLTDYDTVVPVLPATFSGTSRCYFVVKDSMLQDFKLDAGWMYRDYFDRLISESQWEEMYGE